MSIAMRMVLSRSDYVRRGGGAWSCSAVGVPGGRGGDARRPVSILALMPPAAALPTDPRPSGPTGGSAWRDVDWRAHRRFVEVDGRQVNVVDIGEGDPPIVFVH